MDGHQLLIPSDEYTYLCNKVEKLENYFDKAIGYLMYYDSFDDFHKELVRGKEKLIKDMTREDWKELIMSGTD